MKLTYILCINMVAEVIRPPNCCICHSDPGYDSPQFSMINYDTIVGESIIKWSDLQPSYTYYYKKIKTADI